MLGAMVLTLLGGLWLLTLHVSTSGSFPRPLTAKQERDCLERMSRGDRAARNELVEHNLRLVAHIVKKYYAVSGEQDDLISIGTIGLIKAVETYNLEKKTKFATYASRCIENEILMYFRSQKKLQGEVSLSDSIDTDQDGNSLSFMDVISVDDTMLEDLSASETRGVLRCLVQTCLTPRERDIVEQRYGLDGKPPRTQREIAAACGISRSYVSRLEKKALEKLGREFERTQK